IITDHPGDEASLLQALKTGPYGRCVYHCDNDVVDHQIVLMTLENGISVSFTMHGHSHEEGRTIRIDGSEATLLGKFSWNRTFIQVRQHRSGYQRTIDMPNNIEGGGHGGGDKGLIHAFANTLNGETPETLTDARSALESHLLAFAAEEARLTGTVIRMADFKTNAERTQQ
ncbi:MAG: gfo/Idh/MocA family oxidoreductase, partial [Anaerolineales bacterium]